MKQLQEKQERKRKKKENAAQGSRPPASPDALPPTIEAGMSVKIKGQAGVGEVLEINGKNAIVRFGMLKTNVKADRLERSASSPAERKPATQRAFVGSQTQEQIYEKKLHFKQDIDVRGMSGTEAVQAVTYFIDDAILLGISRVRILHGTGTGVLRQLIRHYLSTVQGVAHFRDEHVQFGGAGITVVDLA